MTQKEVIIVKKPQYELITIQFPKSMRTMKWMSPFWISEMQVNPCVKEISLFPKNEFNSGLVFAFLKKKENEGIFLIGGFPDNSFAIYKDFKKILMKNLLAGHKKPITAMAVSENKNIIFTGLFFNLI